MNVGLIDVDGHNFPNLALMKISAWHKSQGDHAEWWDGFTCYDRIYMSKVFTTEYSPDALEPCNANEIVKGGTGYGLENKLPDYIEHLFPDYSLYPQFSDTAYGFLTRGCPRGCKFCIVAEKEGRCSRKVADLSEFWRGQRHIELLDPNILASPDHMDLLQQIVKSKAWVNFNQGLDVRLINKENMELINQVKTKMFHFAWDWPEWDMIPYFETFQKLTTCKDNRKKRVYVLTNFGSTHDQDLYRINTLRRLGFDPYVMIYEKSTAPHITRQLQRWCNNKFIFWSCEQFEDYGGNK